MIGQEFDESAGQGNTEHGEKKVQQLGLLRSDEIDNLSTAKLAALDDGLRRLFAIAVPVKASKERASVIFDDFVELLVIVGLTLPRRHYESGISAYRYRSMFRNSTYTPAQRLSVYVEFQKAVCGNPRWREEVAETFREVLFYRQIVEQV